MESIINKSIYDYMISNYLFTNDQFAFRHGRSTEDQLLLTSSEIFSWVDLGSCVDLIIFDFRKAFDVICHDILLTELYSKGSLLGEGFWTGL